MGHLLVGEVLKNFAMNMHTRGSSRLSIVVNNLASSRYLNLRGVMLPRAVVLTHLSSSVSAANITEEMPGFSVQVSSIVHMLGAPGQI